MPRRRISLLPKPPNFEDSGRRRRRFAPEAPARCAAPQERRIARGPAFGRRGLAPYKMRQQGFGGEAPEKKLHFRVVNSDVRYSQRARSDAFLRHKLSP